MEESVCRSVPLQSGSCKYQWRLYVTFLSGASRILRPADATSMSAFLSRVSQLIWGFYVISPWATPKIKVPLFPKCGNIASPVVAVVCGPCSQIRLLNGPLGDFHGVFHTMSHLSWMRLWIIETAILVSVMCRISPWFIHLKVISIKPYTSIDTPAPQKPKVLCSTPIPLSSVGLMGFCPVCHTPTVMWSRPYLYTTNQGNQC